MNYLLHLLHGERRNLSLLHCFVCKIKNVSRLLRWEHDYFNFAAGLERKGPNGNAVLVINFHELLDGPHTLTSLSNRLSDIVLPTIDELYQIRRLLNIVA